MTLKNWGAGTSAESDPLSKGMKRLGNLYHQICSVENLQRADAIARMGKKQYGIRVHDKNRDNNIQRLHLQLVTKTYCTSPYTTFKVYEPKERTVLGMSC